MWIFYYNSVLLSGFAWRSGGITFYPRGVVMLGLAFIYRAIPIALRPKPWHKWNG